MIDKKILLWVFLSLATIATLFPPCLFGEQEIENEQARVMSMPQGMRYGYFNSHPHPRAPLRGYSFLFKPSNDRRILVPDLALEYIFAFILSSLCALYIVKRRERAVIPADFDSSAFADECKAMFANVPNAKYEQVVILFDRFCKAYKAGDGRVFRKSKKRLERLIRRYCVKPKGAVFAEVVRSERQRQ